MVVVWVARLVSLSYVEGPTATLLLNGTALVGRTRPEYVSYNFEFGDGGAGGTVNNLERLIYLGRQLHPAYLRVGGNSADVTVYKLGREANCIPHNNSGPPRASGVGMAERCMSTEQLHATADFAAEVGAKVVFDVNEYYGYGSPGENLGGGPRPQRPGPVNLTNAADLLAWWRDNPSAVPDKVTLGNELPNNLSPAVTAEDFSKFARLLKDYKATPELLGTDAWWKNRSWLGELLAHPELPRLGAFTFHLYLLGEDISESRLLDPAILDTAAAFAAAYNDELARGGRPGLPLWITEAGAAWGGAIDTYGPTYIDGFWFLDQLGSLARHNVIVQHRHALAGSWGPCFIGRDPEFIPRPDFFTAVLWKRLVGTGVLQTRVLADTAPANGLLRVYAHCHATSPPTHVTLAVVNLANHTWRLRLPDLRGDSVDVYWLTPGSTGDGLVTPDVALNDKVLAVRGSAAGPWTMPTMMPRAVALADKILDIPAQRYGFVVIDTSMPACA
eukprot:CAMPEP_0206285916 /NCGR_PEP_ID=MMETSP0106_2-20121207/338_1 /ASSEMBLY_ACC=CAM_ASM_000206 /TAXON_ID=81532 /ORGANISM="Acanthoeca-like sp., Strain 10tr" /LENGTH=501 /DNA_ID=CAMNT_0053716435 /DNA_START=18 /DNA_END=1523 /DNA_ORIENTATION=+